MITRGNVYRYNTGSVTFLPHRESLIMFFLAENRVPVHFIERKEKKIKETTPA